MGEVTTNHGKSRLFWECKLKKHPNKNTDFSYARQFNTKIFMKNVAHYLLGK